MLSVGIRLKFILSAYLVVNISEGEFSDAYRFLPEVLIVDEV